MSNFMSNEVRSAFAAFPDHVRACLLQARTDIMETTAAIVQGGPPPGRLEETLKWGQPAYI